jgi:hypothetical protein
MEFDPNAKVPSLVEGTESKSRDRQLTVTNSVYVQLQSLLTQDTSSRYGMLW